MIRGITYWLVLACLAPTSFAITLDDCQKMARENYPLLKRYELIEKTEGYTLSNIGNNYLPKISLFGQASYQSDVMTLPDPLKNMLEMQGYDVEGLHKDQYKLGVELNQVIWDGGNISAAKDMARAKTKAQKASTEVELYTLRKRVNDLYFGILLLQERITLTGDLIALLKSNEERLESLYKNGVAVESDVNSVKVERLAAEQRKEILQNNRETLRGLLAVFIAKDTSAVVDLQKPAGDMPDLSKNNRPELAAFDAQIQAKSAEIAMLDRGNYPVIALFGQAYYGYPSFDMFDDMFDYGWSLNWIVGIRLQWNLSNFYTKSDEKKKVESEKALIENGREIFEFNTKLQNAQETSSIENARRQVESDKEIIVLRTGIREAAEVKYQKGVIDVSQLLQEITRENQAKVDCALHEVEMLKSIYDLKTVTNQ